MLIQTNRVFETTLENQQEKTTPPVAGTLGTLVESSVIERRATMGLLILIVLYTIYFARGLLLPFFLALFLSAVLQPFVQLLNRLKIPDSVAAGIVIFLLVVMMGVGIYQTAAPATEWFGRRQLILQEMEAKVRKLRESIQQAREATKTLEQITKLDEDSETVVIKGPGLAEQLLTQAQSVLATGAVILVLVYFLLSRGRPTLERLATGLPGWEESRKWAQILVQIQHEIATYLLTITVINATLGLLTAVAMSLLGMPSPVLWGVMAGVLNFIPYLGAATTALVIALVSILTFDTWLRIVLPPFVFFCFTALEGQFITPTIVGKRLILNPIVVFVSILFWGWVWGVAGMLLAVPILATLKIISKHIESLQPVREIIKVS